MSRICPRLIRLFLAAALIFGGVMTHVGSVVHAASSDFGIPHGHANPTGASALFGTVAVSESEAESKTDTDDPSHALGFCIDAHCCTPAVHPAAHDGLRHSLESGKLIFGPASNYALSVAYSLLKPPRAIA